MEFMNDEQTRMSLKLKFNEGGICDDCCIKNGSKLCSDSPCIKAMRKDGKDGNWIVDDAEN
jgi:hypothetical protein